MLPLRNNVPTRTFPVVTVGLIAANFVVWFWELSGRGLDYHVVKDGFYPCSVQGPCEAVVLNGQPVSHHLSWLESTFTWFRPSPMPVSSAPKARLPKVSAIDSNNTLPYGRWAQTGSLRSTRTKPGSTRR